MVTGEVHTGTQCNNALSGTRKPEEERQVDHKHNVDVDAARRGADGLLEKLGTYSTVSSKSPVAARVVNQRNLRSNS